METRKAVDDERHIPGIPERFFNIDLLSLPKRRDRECKGEKDD